jgi:hypothetical protein
MYLVYRINEQSNDFIPVMPEDALYDVFHRFHPQNLDLLHGTEDIVEYQVGDHYIDSGDWIKGYSTYYNSRTKEKVLVIDTLYEHTNPTVRRLIREYRIRQL